MADENILDFPKARPEPMALAVDVACPQQLDLFAGIHTGTRALVFIGLEQVDQNILLNAFTKNAVRTVIDLRSRPVFPKPRFDHKYILTYLYQRSVNYIERTMVDLHEDDDHHSALSLDRLSNWMADAQQTGFTACIVDSAAIEDGYVAAFRRRIARGPNRWLEVHPRSILSL